MRIRYIFPLSRKVIFRDHWQIPFLDGVCQVIEVDGYAQALEVVFAGLPLDEAPRFEVSDGGEIAGSLVNNDHRLSLVTPLLSDAVAFLQCYFDFDLAWDEVNALYEGETEEEKALIQVTSFGVGRHDPALVLSFDMLCRALYSANAGSGPKFESTLITAARKALFDKQYINSFRYSFLLIEAIFGEGKFHMAALKSALKENVELRDIVEKVLADPFASEPEQTSDTYKLLTASPSVDTFIDHMVDKRGFYFHGNIRRKDAWRPESQMDAKALAFVSLSVVQGITQRAAASLFTEKFISTYFNDAKQTGAIVMYEISFNYKAPEETFSRTHRLNMKVPGSKPTPTAALQVVKEFIKFFEEREPVSELEDAVCTVAGEQVFELKLMPPR